MHKVGLNALCAYVFSAYANDLAMRAMHGKAYLSWVAAIILPFAFLLCGTGLRGAKHSLGKAWLGFAAMLIIGTPFSIWRGETITLLQVYLPRVFGLFFYICAFCLTLQLTKKVFNLLVFCTTAILLCAALFGGVDDGGRFAIPDSNMFGGANDLGLALAVSLPFTMTLILRKKVWLKIFGLGQFLASLMYILKTGSRGSFLGLAAFVIVWLVFSSKRSALLMLAIPGIGLVPFLPKTVLSRLVAINVSSSTSISEEDNEAIASQKERQMLLNMAIEFAITHPVFGVGASTFTEALNQYDKAHHTHTHALGTHNSYAQIASECGFPALFLYVGILLGTIVVNYRLMRLTRTVKEADPVYVMALCLFCSAVIYMVNSGFHHVGYSQTLPIVSGLTAALWMATGNGNLEVIKAEVAAGGF